MDRLPRFGLDGAHGIHQDLTLVIGGTGFQRALGRAPRHFADAARAAAATGVWGTPSGDGR
jgi:hypothetical protein